MTTNQERDLSQRLARLSDEALMDLLANAGDYTPEALMAARAEVARRGGEETLRNAVLVDPARSSQDGTQVQATLSRWRFAAVVAMVFAGAFGLSVLGDAVGVGSAWDMAIFSLWLALGLPILITAAVRRLRDVGFNEWWACLMIVPAVNMLFLLALMTWPSAAAGSGETRQPIDSDRDGRRTMR